jgi:hypothetical protein
MTVPWPCGPGGLPLPAWLRHDPCPGFATRRLTFVLVLKAAELRQLEALIQPGRGILLPPGSPIASMIPDTPLDVAPLAGGWFRASADAIIQDDAGRPDH